jgi:ABC-2 type transport system ATP-binding protein
MSCTTKSQPAIRVDGLTKRFGDTVAVEALDFEVPTGVVAGFIGPNGAGKTTTMGMLLGLVRPTGGHASVLGQPITRPDDFLPRVGALIEGPALWPALTGAENLRALAVLGGFDQRQVPELLDLVGLGHRADDRLGGYSLGMKQRLGIASALLGDPDLLVLDEPTNGLDPAGMNQMRNLIAELGEGDRTVFVSSHLLAELEQISDWLVVIDEGSSLYQGPADEFLADAIPVVVARPERDDDLERLLTVAGGAGLEADREGGRHGGRIVLHVDGHDPRSTAASLNRAASSAGIVLSELRVELPDLQAQYLARIEANGHQSGGGQS